MSIQCDPGCESAQEGVLRKGGNLLGTSPKKSDAEIILFLLLNPFYFLLLPSALPRRFQKARWNPWLCACVGYLTAQGYSMRGTQTLAQCQGLPSQVSHGTDTLQGIVVIQEPVFATLDCELLGNKGCVRVNHVSQVPIRAQPRAGIIM